MKKCDGAVMAVIRSIVLIATRYDETNLVELLTHLSLFLSPYVHIFGSCRSGQSVREV